MTQADYHLIGLCKLGLFQDALISLTHYLGVHELYATNDEMRTGGPITTSTTATPSLVTPSTAMISSNMMMPSMVVSDAAWLSLFRGALAKGYVDVALEVSKSKQASK